MDEGQEEETNQTERQTQYPPPSMVPPPTNRRMQGVSSEGLLEGDVVERVDLIRCCIIVSTEIERQLDFKPDAEGNKGSRRVMSRN